MVQADPCPTELKDNIQGMAREWQEELKVTVIKDPDHRILCVSLFRRGGCGKLYRNVCLYLRTKFRGWEIILLENPKPERFATARVREEKANHFHRTSLRISDELIGRY